MDTEEVKSRVMIHDDHAIKKLTEALPVVLNVDGDDAELWMYRDKDGMWWVGYLLQKQKEWLKFKNGDYAVRREQLGEALSGMLEMLKVSGLMPND